MSSLSHAVRRMGGRDPHEAQRGATPLELLFDLTFVIAFGAAADELAHLLAEGHVWSGILAFCWSAFAISWAWVQYSWFASAYDTDDWVYRLLTMVQMAGVLVLALGLPAVFESFEQGDHIDNRVMVLGYVVMRVPLVFQWLRAAGSDPARRGACLTYAATIVAAQALWCLGLLVAPTVSIPTFVGLMLVPFLLELVGPVIAERRGDGTPWHPHHIAERYGLLAIIALGEGLLGTMVAISAIVGPLGPGWSLDVAVLGMAGVTLTFGIWWTYFILPAGQLLRRHPERHRGWAYGHLPMYGAIVAIGAGLHVAAYYIEHHSVLSTVGTVLSVAVPVSVYLVVLYVVYSTLTRAHDPLHAWLLAGTAAVVVASVLLAVRGFPMEWCIATLALAPWVGVVGYEISGYRHNERMVAGD